MKISEAFEEYIASEVVMAGLSPHTEESYTCTAKHVVRFLGNKNVRTIDMRDVIGFFEYLTSWQRPDTCRLYMICFRSVLKYLHRKSYIDFCPDDIKIPKKEKRRIDYLTEEQVKELITTAREKRPGLPEINRRRNLALVMLLFSSGARIGEVCKLNRNSIHDGQFIAVGKSKEPRPCFVNEETRLAIKDYLDLRTDKAPALFISNQTQKRLTPGNAQEIFRNLRKRCNLGQVHPHTLRHSFATCMLAHEVDLRYIGDMLGHQSLDTTRIYTHFENAHLKRVHSSVMN